MIPASRGAGAAPILPAPGSEVGSAPPPAATERATSSSADHGAAEPTRRPSRDRASVSRAGHALPIHRARHAFDSIGATHLREHLTSDASTFVVPLLTVRRRAVIAPDGNAGYEDRDLGKSETTGAAAFKQPLEVISATRADRISEHGTAARSRIRRLYAARFARSHHLGVSSRHEISNEAVTSRPESLHSLTIQMPRSELLRQHEYGLRIQDQGALADPVAAGVDRHGGLCDRRGYDVRRIPLLDGRRHRCPMEDRQIIGARAGSRRERLQVPRMVGFTDGRRRSR